MPKEACMFFFKCGILTKHTRRKWEEGWVGVCELDRCREGDAASVVTVVM